MKQIVAAILSVIILLSASPQAATYWMWKINQSNIVKTLCVQKDEVVNMCHGTCHLNAQLNIVDDENSPLMPIESEFRTISLYCIDIENYYLSPQDIPTKKSIFTGDRLFIDRLKIERLLRPPELLV